MACHFSFSFFSFLSFYHAEHGLGVGEKPLGKRHLISNQRPHQSINFQFDIN